MVNIFDVIAHYQVGYNVVDERDFTSAEKARIESAEVVNGSYGLSVCFHMNNNQGVTYIRLDTNSKLNVGEVVSIEDLKLRTLQKPGDTKTSLRVIEAQ